MKEKWNGKLHELPQSLQPHFLHLCRISHKGIVQNENQLIFYEDDIPEGSTTLGFMNSVHPLYQSITKTASPSFNFIHLTLQEFLAAIHIWRTYSQQDQLYFIETQSKKYYMIILFLSGLTKLSDPWTKCVLPTPRVYNRNVLPGEMMVVSLSRQHILWLYETQNDQLISSFDNIELSVSLMQVHSDPLYFLALGYCIAVGNVVLHFNMHITLDYCEQNYIHLLAELRRHNSKCSSQVKVLDIQQITWPFPDTRPFPDNLYDIFNYIPAATQGVLHVRNGIHMPLASELSKFLENVETITIPSTILPNSLEILRYSRNLKILHCHIHDSETTGILSDRITEFCPSLEYLEVRVTISVSNDKSVRWMPDESDSQYLLFGLNIKKFKELKRRQLFPLNFGPIFTEAFTEQANKFTDHFADFFKCFGLFTSSIPLCTLGLIHLVSHSLSKCSLLEKLTIDFSSTPHQRQRLASGQDRKILQNLDIIFKALRENSSVRKLSCKVSVEFTSNQIIDEFCALLQQNSSLEEIDIEVVDMIVRTFEIQPTLMLKQIMKTVYRPTLKKFVITSDFRPMITNNDEIMAICDVLENNKYLEHLHLPKLCVEPQQRFLLPIANALSKNSSLTTLILEFEPTAASIILCDNTFERLRLISLEAKAFGDMLKVNKTLRFLYLMVDIPDWSPIIEGLKLNTTIRELHIPSSAKKSAIKCIDYVHVRSRIIVY